MAFRDDREALRARAEVLEGEVDALRDELERARRKLAAQEAKDERDEVELGQLRAEVEALRRRVGTAQKPPEPQKNGPGPVVVGSVVALLVLFAVGAFVTLTSEKVEVREATPVEAAPVAVAEPRPEPTTTPLDAARFGAVVLSATGVALEPGDGCVVEADLTATAAIARMRVFCDDVLYDSTASGGTEMTAHDEHVVGHARAGGEHVYELRWVDTGTRTGPRPQITVDTQRQTARIWRDVGRPFDVRLHVEDLSAARVGPPLGSTVSDTDLGSLHMRAEPTRRTGATPDVLDEGCELRGHADRESGLGCRLTLRCGDAVVYGAETSGYNRCRPLADAPGAAPDVADDEGTTAEDGDPALHLRASEHRLVVADTRGGEAWEAELSLSEDPRCELDGSWHGRLRTMTGESPGLRLVPQSSADVAGRANGRAGERGSDEGARAIIAPGLPSGLATVELDCAAGTGALVLEDGTRYQGRFGPGFATFLGRVRGGTPAAFWLRRGLGPDQPLVVPGTPVGPAR